MNNQVTKPKQSILHGVLSFILPGLGQFVAGQRSRGISLFLTVAILGWLSTWTIAQRARFPDLVVGRNVFIPVFLQCLALLIFLIALLYIVERWAIRDESNRTFLNAGFVILFLMAVFFLQDSFLEMAGSQEDLARVYGGTAILAGATLAAFYVWQVRDAMSVGSGGHPSLINGILLGCLVVFSLGWNITGIDLPKAIAEYRDTQIILRRILWPWQAAFEYDQIVVESTAKIQAPCPAGETGPEIVTPHPTDAWVSVTPTCGDLSERDLRNGDLTLGTEVTITGGNFLPGSEVNVLWKNPIGNPFTPRGVGETKIVIADDGTFESVLNIPEVVIPAEAVGAQVHSLVIRQESGEVFSGRPSREIKLALVGMLETIMMGLMATFFGVVFAFPFSFLAARNLMSPIASPLNRVIGGLLGVLPGIWLAGQLTGMVSNAIGGLENAPIQIAFTGLVLLLVFGYFGSKLGGELFDWLKSNVSPLLSRALTGLGAGAMAAGAGYFLGTWFNRGVVTIPLGEEAAALTESSYALGFAVVLGVLAATYAFLRAHFDFSVGMVVYSIARTLMNIVRSIEPLIWAIIATIWIGLGPFAGTIALTLHTIAALGKLYSESIESIDPGPIEALQATGANRLQTIVYAVVPQILPPYISFTIYRWDINVRMSTIIGAVGGGGIGFILIQWIRQFQYDAAGLAVWLITITVATLDYVSSNIRERFV